MTSFYSVEDARNRAAARLPKMIFDYIDGAAGNELLAAENTAAMHNIKLQPRVLVNIEEYSADGVVRPCLAGYRSIPIQGCHTIQYPTRAINHGFEYDRTNQTACRRQCLVPVIRWWQ